MDLAASLHDAADPVSEAEAQLSGVRDKTHTIVLLGAGLGFVTQVAATRWPDAKVIVLEPSADIARLAVRHSPGLYESGRVRILVGPDYAGAGELWKIFDRPEAADPEGLAVVRDAVLTQTMPMEIVKAYKLLARAIESARMNRHAREENAGRYLLNTLRNLPAILRSSDPARLVAQFAAVPAVIVGAGPSLDRQIEDLRAIGDRALIIAADTAWRPLVAAGIDPHFVVAVDPTEANGRHLRGVPASRETWGVVEGSVDPRSVTAFGDSLFTFRVANHHPWPWLQSLGIQRPIVRAWGSVLTSALDLALAFGCDPVVFAGSDMAFTDGRPYCRGTSFEEDWARHTARGASLRQVWHNTLTARKLLNETGISGAPVQTAPHLIEFRNWIVQRATEARTASQQRVFNSTPDGILSGGAIQQVNLRSTFCGRPACDAMIREVIHQRRASAPASATFESVRETLSALEEQSPEVLQEWLTFGRPSLTTDAILTAIEDSARRTGGDGRVLAAVRPPRPRIYAADRVARTRARLTGDATGLDGSEDIRSEVFEAAIVSPVDAAGECIRALLALPQLTAGWGEDASNGSDPATVPLSLRYIWTDEARPFADALEGWLLHPVFGATPQAETSSSDSHFWNGRLIATTHACQDDTERSAAEHDAQRALVEMQVDMWRRQNPNRSGRLNTSIDHARTLPNLLDGITRAITGTIARPSVSARDPRMAFFQHAVAHVEPRVLTDHGLPIGWHLVVAGSGHAIFTPRLSASSVSIDADGAATTMRAWPHPIVGEIPFGEAGGAVAWNGGDQLILSRARVSDEPRCDRVSFQPSRVVRTAEGTLVFLAADGGLWEWTSDGAERRLIETPKCVGLRLDGDELVLAPVARSAAGYLLRQRLPFEYRYDRGDPGLRECAVGREGPSASRSTAASWTATTFPFADLVRLDASDGRSLVLAVYSPLQVAWAGASLIVTITDGVTLLFPQLGDLLERIDSRELVAES
jgi:6-hydroxymethylpterin diphosphokinase MptE-like